MAYKIGPVGTGTVSGSGTTTLTGAGTAFTSQCAAGDTVHILLSGGSIETRTVASVTSATALEVTTNLSTFSARAFFALRLARTVFTFEPRSTPKQPQELLLSGLYGNSGYAQTLWEFAAVDLDTLYAARYFVTGGAYAALAYVTTMVDQRSALDDVFKTYRAVVRFPQPEAGQRWSHTRLAVTLEMALLVEVTV